MFAKAFRVRSNTAIKGSDRRKLRADVMAAFPTLGTDQVSVLVPGKEELNIVKLYAHRGDAVTVYVSGGNPILFEVEKNLYPTDLMLPGLVVPPAGLPPVQKGDLCAIALLGNRVAAPVCILTNIARGFPSLHIFTNTCCFLCCLC
ncbi:eukaryotic translation initiation factor 2D-like isoform X3 [Acinonyx jubatus]|uniref:Eukaryotic translation initiation factor 2D-like isoform X3 n=1 Tax=Acinonyx jubatus TaxID=32536 RepID=A0ABM3P0F2_ACIJB|nr:eukaryotic translation initiation factor 2D-like isoform X3 [Acinonyx jubatus]